jgi:hypothetical protein
LRRAVYLGQKRAGGSREILVFTRDGGPHGQDRPSVNHVAEDSIGLSTSSTAKAPMPRPARSWLLGALLVVALSVPAGRSAAARTVEWADSREAAGNPAYAASRAICLGLKAVTVPPADAPDAVAAAGLSDCSSQALYYGIGRPAEPKAARLCAVLEKQTADPQVEDFGFTGDRTLMMVYANGLGAPRDLDVATALACRTAAAPAEVDARVRHLARLKAEHWTGTTFSLCDDVTSGLMAGVCADHDQLVARADRAKVLTALTAGWSKDDRAAFAALDRAKAAFVDAHGENEVDQTGSGRVAFVVAAEDEGERAFVTLLEEVEAGKLLPATEAEAKAADAALAARYHELVAKGPTFRGTTVTLAGVAATQRAWQRYRDAWVVFAGRKYPTLSPSALLLRLARDRTAQLGNVPAMPD